jgi:hypothetical protein
MIDMALQLQMHIWEGLYARLGVNIPMHGTLTLEMDDKSKEAIQGGELDATAGIGYDAMVVYELMDHFNVTGGFSMSNHDIKEERTDGTEYTVKFDASNLQFFVGFDYTLPLRFLN